jgi:hypothetical protein
MKANCFSACWGSRANFKAEPGGSKGSAEKISYTTARSRVDRSDEADVNGA